jgi:hypothetical protein
MFDRLRTALSADAGDAGADGDDENKLPDDLKNNIMTHLERFEVEMAKYFPDIEGYEVKSIPGYRFL